MNHNTLKSTRLWMVVVMWVAATTALGFGQFNADQWISFNQWLFGIYSVSEMGAKSAQAYRDKVSG